MIEQIKWAEKVTAANEPTTTLMQIEKYPEIKELALRL